MCENQVLKVNKQIIIDTDLEFYITSFKSYKETTNSHRLIGEIMHISASSILLKPAIPFTDISSLFEMYGSLDMAFDASPKRLINIPFKNITEIVVLNETELVRQLNRFNWYKTAYEGYKKRKQEEKQK